MRRPLCLGTLLWLAALMVMYLVFGREPLGGYDELERMLDGQEVTLTGTIAYVTGSAPEQTCYIDSIKIEQIGGREVYTDVTDAGETYKGSPAFDSAGIDPAEIRIAGRLRAVVKPGDGGEGEFHGAAVSDQVRVKGKVTFPTVPTNPGQFDDRTYCAAQGILFRIYDGEMETVKRGAGPARLLQLLRDRMALCFQEDMGADEAAVLTGITLGDSTEISSGTRDLFREGGIAHILAVSALHVNLVAMSLYRFLRRRGVPIWGCVLLAAMVLYAYMLMTGMSMSSVRAFVMFAVWGIAQISGRRTDLPTSLAAAALVITIRRPAMVMDGGFYLSFGCVLSLHLLSRPIQKALVSLIQRRGFIRGARVNSLASSMAVTLGTLPICCWFYFQITPYSFLVNLLVLPCMSFLFAFGTLGGLAGLIAPPLGQFILSVCQYILDFFMLLCREERRLPFGVLITGRPGLWQVAVYYLLLGTAVWLIESKGAKRMRGRENKGNNGNKRNERNKRNKEKRMAAGNEQGPKWYNCGYRIRKDIDETDGKKREVKRESGNGVGRGRLQSLGLAMAILILALTLLCMRIPPAYRVSFLDVGQGDCILLQVQGRNFLVDCGSTSIENVWDRRVSPALKFYGISHLDGVFVSHGDSDHISGIRTLLQDYERNMLGDNCGDVSVDALFLSQAAGTHEAEDASSLLGSDVWDEAAHALGGLAGERDIPVITLAPGDSIPLGRSAALACLYPDTADINALQGDVNMCSMVLELRCQDTVLLLTGDLEKEGEERFIKWLREKWAHEEDEDGDNKGNYKEYESGSVILKVGHHGSRNATFDTLLELLQPDIAVISCGRNNRYGHPAERVLTSLDSSGTETWRTDREGCIVIAVSHGGVMVKPYLQVEKMSR